jgi:hypothetical protein
MKLTDELKDKIKNAKTKEEVDAILAETKGGVQQAGIILDEEELNAVAGGLPLVLPDGHASVSVSNEILKRRS